MVVVARQDNGQILVWRNGSSDPTTTIAANSSAPWSLFVTSDDQILVGNDPQYRGVDRWTLNQTRLSSPIFVCDHCAGLFVDLNNNLYCAQDIRHQVLRKSLDSPVNALNTIVAGTGCASSTSNSLNCPNGVFVEMNLDLYVADCFNHRIQMFRSGEMNATTVAGNGSNGTITLNRPTGVVLDGDGYLFIVDCFNNRIVGSGPDGFRCLMGCNGNGSASNQLSNPFSLSFDRDGNMFVTDRDNNRIQKFLLSSNSCSKYKDETKKKVY